MTPNIRWLIKRDYPGVLRIEKTAFEYPWTEEDFANCLRQRNCIGMVAEVHAQIVGYMIYELHKSNLHLLTFAVDSDLLRTGIGTAMIDKLKSKLSQQRRKHITLEVRETNLPAQLFFKNQGFKATGVLRDHYECSPESAYIMRYSIEEESFVPHNRISVNANLERE